MMLTRTKSSLFAIILYTILTIVSPQNQNVLLIIVDDLRPALGAYGAANAYTPNIDNLAQKSFVFKNAFCQEARCAPSRNSFLTSRRPDTLHLYDSNSYWRDTVGDFMTLPQYFRVNDYYTHSIGKIFKSGISSNFNDDREYSWSQEPFRPDSEMFEHAKVCLTRDGSLAHNLICPVLVKEQPSGVLPDLESLNAALEFIRRSDEITNCSPYFLAVGFSKPHVPFRFPIKYLREHPLSSIKLPTVRWRPPSLPNIARSSWSDIRSFDDIKALNITSSCNEISDYLIKEIIQAYSSSVTYIDEIIGRLLAKIKDDTIIVLLGDHGFSLGEHGEFSKFSNFDVATRVPLIIHVPKLLCQTMVIDELVELVDLFPTLVELTGMSPKLQRCNQDGTNSELCTEGVSLVPLMMSKLQPTMELCSKSAVFSQYPKTLNPPDFPGSDTPTLHEIKIMGYSIRTKFHRYTEWVEFDWRTCTPNWDHVYDRELYDHSIDPHENFNIADREDMCEIMEMLRRKLVLGWRYA